MSRFRNRTPPWQYLRAFQIDGIAVYQDLAVAARFSATVRATIIPVHRCGELEQQ